MLKSRNRSAAEKNYCRQNHLRRISDNLWVKVSSDQLTQQNPHQELPGSEVSVLHNTWTKEFNERKERDHPHTYVFFIFQ